MNHTKLATVASSGETNVRREDNSGAVMIELTVALAFLVFLFFATSEYVRALQARQNLAVLIREAANAAFRECAEFDPAYIGPCLQDVHDRVVDSSAHLLAPGIELILSVYKNDVKANPSDPPVDRASIVGADSSTNRTPSGHESRFPPTFFTSHSNAQDHRSVVATQGGRIVIAEGFYRFQALVGPNIAWVIPDFYDAAIY